jgi:predicted ATPase/DNA-binding SARP family transcriptional activator
MEFGILGPLAVWKDGDELALGPAKQRAVLAVLLLRANEVVPTAKVVEELWGEQPPLRAAKTVQVFISQLRKILGEGVVETRGAGYVLRAEAGTVDSERFERLLGRGGSLLSSGAAAEAAAVLRDALAVWRGPALADLQDESFALHEIARLEQLRLVALTQQHEAELALGRHTEVVPELETLVREHPLREGLRRLLILALYRSGRQAEALAAYHDARARLVDELGLDPSPSLRRLEKAILLQDPSLDLPAPTRSTDDLPVGTVTFLFTDIEGSTEQLARLGTARYSELLEEHRRLLRAASAQARGHEIGTQGDAFFAVFPSATGAVQAAAQAQRELAATPLQARMGIHTGEPLLLPTGYVGLDIHRASRICSAGHGGQVLISQPTRELVEAELPAGVTLRDLGEHRLKDLTRPQRLTQLVIEGLRNDFPRLRTLENRPTNLPIQTTPLIGRKAELAIIEEQLRSNEVRLLTLTGPGGAGKTRLGVQVAAELLDDFPHGVFFVALAPILDPDLVLPTVAQTLGIADTGAASLVDLIVAHLRHRRLLLVVDNFEHLLEAAPPLADLLTAAPDLKILVTSRIPLHISAEHEFAVTPLGLPDPMHPPDPSSVAQYDAVALFIERARAVKHDFEVTSANAPAIAEICVRLDGLPLAIELAAARVKLLSPPALLARLERSFDVLTAGPRDKPARQQTVRATIDWSFQLLVPEEQALFAHLAVFQGGCTLAAAEAVCGPEELLARLAALIDANVLRQEEQPDGEPRFEMLETIRSFALERLQEAGDRDEIRRRHAEYFLFVAEQIEPNWREGDFDPLTLELDHANFRTALKTFADLNDRESAVRLMVGLTIFWTSRGHLRDFAHWTDIGVQWADDLPLGLQARVWDSASITWRWRRDLMRAAEFALKALETTRRAGERNDEAWALRQLGVIAHLGGNLDEARSRYDEAARLFRQLDEPQGIRIVTHDQGVLAIERGDFAAAHALLEDALAQARELGTKTYVSVNSLISGFSHSTSVATTTQYHSSSKASKAPWNSERARTSRSRCAASPPQPRSKGPWSRQRGCSAPPRALNATPDGRRWTATSEMRSNTAQRSSSIGSMSPTSQPPGRRAER